MVKFNTHNLSLKVSLVVPVLVGAIAVLVTTLVNIIQSDTIHELNRYQTQVLQKDIDSLNEAYRDIYQIESSGLSLLLAVKDHHLFGINESEIDSIRTVFNYESSKTVLRFKSLLHDESPLNQQEREIVKQVADLSLEWINTYRKLFDAPQNAESTHNIHFKLLTESVGNMRGMIKIIEDKLNTARLESLSMSQSLVTSNTIVTEVGAALVILSALLVVLYNQLFVIRPIGQLSNALKGIASQDADLSKRLKVNGNNELGQISDSFNTFAQRVDSTMFQVVAASNHIRSEMNDIQSLTHSVTEFSSQQVTESEVVAAAVHQLQATSDSVSTHASDAAEQSAQVTKATQSANSNVKEAVSSIRELSSNVGDTSDVLNNLDKEVSNICSILSQIKGIAEQTNLLALNAAIEAARAGEQGRGFAVVADEVRALASKTADSTNQIEEMITNLEAGTHSAVQVMQVSLASGDKSIKCADSVSESLGRILSLMDTMNDMNTEIATAASQQSTVSQDVSQHAEAINESTASMTKLAIQAESSCDSLSEQCNSLDELVGQFRLSKYS